MTDSYQWTFLYRSSDDTHKAYTTFKVSENDEPIIIQIRGVWTFFGMEQRYDKKKIKWILTESDGRSIQKFEHDLYQSLIRSGLYNQHSIPLETITSCVYFSGKYPPDFNTIVDKHASSGHIIRHAQGDIVSWEYIKNRNCNIRVQLKHVSMVENSMHPLFEVIEIIPLEPRGVRKRNI